MGRSTVSEPAGRQRWKSEAALAHSAVPRSVWGAPWADRTRESVEETASAIPLVSAEGLPDQSQLLRVAQHHCCGNQFAERQGTQLALCGAGTLARMRRLLPARRLGREQTPPGFP